MIPQIILVPLTVLIVESADERHGECPAKVSIDSNGVSLMQKRLFSQTHALVAEHVFHAAS
jgi:hypothetical protein